MSPNATYHFRAVVQNSEATVNGNDQTFTTDKYSQAITFATLVDKTTNDADFDPGATSDRGLEISYSSSNEQVATIVSGQVHIVGAGTTDITASQAGNDTVYAATPVTQSLNVTQATGLEKYELADLIMYPNPAQNEVTISFGNGTISGKINISVTDINGKILFHKNVQGTNYKIDVSNFPAGMYFVKINIDESVKELKLIIE